MMAFYRFDIGLSAFLPWYFERRAWYVAFSFHSRFCCAVAARLISQAAGAYFIAAGHIIRPHEDWGLFHVTALASCPFSTRASTSLLLIYVVNGREALSKISRWPHGCFWPTLMTRNFMLSRYDVERCEMMTARYFHKAARHAIPAYGLRCITSIRITGIAFWGDSLSGLRDVSRFLWFSDGTVSRRAAPWWFHAMASTFISRLFAARRNTIKVKMQDVDEFRIIDYFLVMLCAKRCCISYWLDKYLPLFISAFTLISISTVATPIFAWLLLFQENI